MSESYTLTPWPFYSAIPDGTRVCLRTHSIAVRY